MEPPANLMEVSVNLKGLLLLPKMGSSCSKLKGYGKCIFNQSIPEWV